MIRPKLSLRRPLAILGALVAGLVATAAVAAPASANLATTNGGRLCLDASEAQFDHTFDGPSGHATVKLRGIKPLCAGEMAAFTLVSYFAPKPQFSWPQYLFNQQTAWINHENRSIELNVQVPQCNTQVDLFRGHEGDVIDQIGEHGPYYGDKKVAWYNGGKQNCTMPSAAFSYDCKGSAVAHLSNTGQLSRYDVEFTVTGAGGWSQKVTVAPNKADDVTVPVGAATDITVTAEGHEWKGAWTAPETCAAPTVKVNPDCDKLSVSVENPDGNATITAAVTYGDKTENLTVAGGATQSVDFTATDATTGKVTFPGRSDIKPVDFVYAKPETCATPTPTPSETPTAGPSGSPTPGPTDSAAPVPSGTVTPGPGTGGGNGGSSLPVTGAAVGGIAVGALLLLAGGGVLYYLARRRRIRFTV